MKTFGDIFSNKIKGNKRSAARVKAEQLAE